MPGTDDLYAVVAEIFDYLAYAVIADGLTVGRDEFIGDISVAAVEQGSEVSVIHSGVHAYLLYPTVRLGDLRRGHAVDSGV